MSIKIGDEKVKSTYRCFIFPGESAGELFNDNRGHGEFQGSLKISLTCGGDGHTHSTVLLIL